MQVHGYRQYCWQWFQFIVNFEESYGSIARAAVPSAKYPTTTTLPKRHA
jgi:hypothetical protein